MAALSLGGRSSVDHRGAMAGARLFLWHGLARATLPSLANAALELSAVRRAARRDLDRRVGGDHGQDPGPGIALRGGAGGLYRTPLWRLRAASGRLVDLCREP